ncbi:cold-regulated protein 27 isoform X4 [Brassica napus]|uniref:cold-regulated protein 27 isoform X4 n=1 Tax=Brassica napus TaxID=3708 RepID=UPI0020785126|nr:cold-regulated protein 27 isoform X4 [Brassica napus]
MVGDYRENYSPSSDGSSSVEEETTSSMYSAGKEDKPTEWTDEKHSLYLKSMEASFVDQLYNSLGALGSKIINKDTVGPSTRFGDGGKPSEEQKMNVRQPEYRLNGRHGRGSHEFLRSPWIKHYKPSPKTLTDRGSSELENQVVSSKGIVICSSGSASSLKQILREGCSSHSRDRDQISLGEEEVSDQNFVNEVTKGQNGSSKKMKTVISESSSTDQVVPLRKSPANMIT